MDASDGNAVEIVVDEPAFAFPHVEDAGGLVIQFEIQIGGAVGLSLLREFHSFLFSSCCEITVASVKSVECRISLKIFPPIDR